MMSPRLQETSQYPQSTPKSSTFSHIRSSWYLRFLDSHLLCRSRQQGYHLALCGLGCHIIGEKKTVKPGVCRASKFFFFLFFWRAGADTQLPAPCLPAWSLFPPKETNSSFSLCGLQVQSRDGWALVSSQCRVVILQPTLAEVSTALHLPQPSQSPLRWKRFAYKQTPLKDTSTLTFLSPFSHLLPFQTPLARLPCSHMRPNYQNNN